ncbi:MAG: sulfatase [Myxococcales bacterium]|nr:sulfatase [Myxococcales bacterium]
MSRKSAAIARPAFWSIVILLWLLAAFGCQALPAPTPVYLIGIDTLRADALGCYGGVHPTPVLDDFAKQAVVFDNCIAPASWTVPSMVSIITGLYPFHHGCVKALQENGRVLSQQKLSDGYNTLAELFKRINYRTYGVSGNGHLDEKYGFAQGFDEYVCHPFVDKEGVTSSWQGIVPRLAAEYRFGQGVFGFLFYFDPHHPYVPQEPYISQYLPDYKKNLDKVFGKDMLELIREGVFADPELVKLARALYESEVAALDAHLGEVLKNLPGYEDAIVIITADHGEEFYEHGEMIHGNNLMQTQIHVPLMIKLPKGKNAGLRVKDPVSTIDIFATLADVLHAPPMSKTDGVSLLPLLEGQPATPRDLFSQIDLPWARQSAMVRWPHKYIQRIDGRRHIFDLAADPREENDAFEELKGGESAEAFKTLLESVGYQVRFPPRSITEDLSDEMHEKLKNLGYLN